MTPENNNPNKVRGAWDFENMAPAELTELSQQATAAAEVFALPKDWRDGRRAQPGYAVDASYSLDPDDAISLSPTGDQLEVSVADVGSFLDDPTIIAQAIRRTRSKYRDQKVVRPMLPAELSEDKLCLTDGEERPALTVTTPLTDGSPDFEAANLEYTVVTATKITPDAVNDQLAGGTADPEIVALYAASRQLFSGRTGLSADQSFVQTEDGSDLVQAGRHNIAGLMVQETMVATNQSAARFLSTHGIPAIYRVHQSTEDGITSHKQPAVYSTEAGPHAGLGVAEYAHFTSPLRRLPDLVNHANVAAYMSDQEDPHYPFDAEDLDYIVDRCNRMAERQLDPDLDQPAQTTALIREAFDNHEVSIVQLTACLFGQVPGDAVEQIEIRQRAAAAIAESPSLARTILGVAIDRKLLVVDDYEPETMHYSMSSPDGRTFSFDDAQPGSATRMQRSIDLLTTISGQTITSQPLDKLDRVQAAKLERADVLLRLNNRLGGFNYQRNVVSAGDPETGELAVVEVSIELNGKTFRASGEAVSDRTAANRAAAELIKRHNLYTQLAHNPADPTVPLELGDDFLTLHTRVAKITRSNAVYSYHQNADGINSCRLDITMPDGSTRRVVAEGKNNKQARLIALRQIMQQLATEAEA